MTMAGLPCRAARAEIVEWFPTRAEADEALRLVLEDEPEWRELLGVVEVEVETSAN